METINTIASTLSEQEARNILRAHDGNLVIDQIHQRYYPYCNYKYGVSFGKGLGRLERNMLCTIDLLRGREALGDGLPQLKEVEVAKAQIISGVLEPETLKEQSQTFILKAISGTVRMIHPPLLTLERLEPFYKLYYIAQCKDRAATPFYIMVDSMDGKLAILDT